MKRTSWISWRIYLFALPINIVVLALGGGHELNSIKDVAIWSLVAIIAHTVIAPFVSLAIPFSQHFNNWRADLLALIGLGIIRGLVINLCVDTFNFVQVITDGYRVFNSAVALPQWFIGLAVFIESRRAYQHEFQALFAKAMRKEQETHERQSLLPKGDSSPEDLLARLQFITSNLAHDIQALLERPDALKDYSREASKIQHFIDEDLRPTSAKLWKSNKVSTPKISFRALVQISFFDQRLRVVPVILSSIPSLFIGLNGISDYKIALSQCLIVAAIDLLYFSFAELFFYFKVLNRSRTNLLVIATTSILPFFLQANLPAQFQVSDKLIDILIYQILLSITYIAFLLGFNSYTVISQQRAEVIASLQRHLSSEKYSESIIKDGTALHNKDIAQYLHGEIQAGLTASSLLLQQAAKSGDSDLANEALERAAGLLSQDHTNISYTRMATPEVKLEKIISGWKGIADITIALPPTVQLEETALRSAVALIEEAIANSIRHAQASQIQVSGILKEDLLTINIISNGDSMVKGKAGLGTKLFDDLASEWSYASESGQNRLTFILVNRL